MFIPSSSLSRAGCGSLQDGGAAKEPRDDNVPPAGRQWRRHGEMLVPPRAMRWFGVEWPRARDAIAGEMRLPTLGTPDAEARSGSTVGVDYYGLGVRIALILGLLLKRDPI